MLNEEVRGLVAMGALRLAPNFDLDYPVGHVNWPLAGSQFIDFQIANLIA